MAALSTSSARSASADMRKLGDILQYANIRNELQALPFSLKFSVLHDLYWLSNRNELLAERLLKAATTLWDTISRAVTSFGSCHQLWIAEQATTLFGNPAWVPKKRDEQLDMQALAQRVHDFCASLAIPDAELHDVDNNSISRLQSRLRAYQYTLYLTDKGEFVPLQLKSRPSCRAMRHFWGYRDRFALIKVQQSRLYAYQAAIRGMLKRGSIQIPGIPDRKYHFLCDHGNKVWLFAPLNGEHGPPELQNIHTLLDWMGNFSDVSIGKLADRIALAFSKSFPLLEVPLKDIHVIRDSIANGKNFTDGIGFFGRSFGERVMQELQRAGWRCNDIPSAIQIRLGGVKGVISYYPRVEDGLYLRHSMIKFPSAHRVLEIVRLETHQRIISMFSPNRKVDRSPLPIAGPSRLNQDLIQLLEVMIPDPTAILRLQQQAIEEIKRASQSQEDAIAFVRKHLNDRWTVRLLQALLAGIPFNGEKFVAQRLSRLQEKLLEQLKEGAKIPVPKSAFLMGIVDESGILKEREVCVKLAKDVFVTGNVAITCYPCLYPSDVQRVEAVARPEFNYLSRVVIFPQRGSRPLPEMMSGHDLDGDFYWVTWDPDLLPDPAKKWAEYAAAPNPQQAPKWNDASQVFPPSTANSDRVRLDALAESFLRHLENELSLVANARKKAAEIYGAGSEEVRELARLQARALDARKLGTPIKCPKKYRNLPKPIWMKSDDKDGNKPVPGRETSFAAVAALPDSTKLLSRLFHAVTTKLTEQRMPTPGREPHEKILIDGWQQYEEEARQAWDPFKKAVASAINLSQLEAKTTKRRVSDPVDEIERQFVQQFMRGATTLSERRKKAAALYYVAYTTARGDKINMVWVFASLLAQNYAANVERERFARGDRRLDVVVSAEAASMVLGLQHVVRQQR